MQVDDPVTDIKVLRVAKKCISKATPEDHILSTPANSQVSFSHRIKENLEDRRKFEDGTVQEVS